MLPLPPLLAAFAAFAAAASAAADVIQRVGWRGKKTQLAHLAQNAGRRSKWWYRKGCLNGQRLETIPESGGPRRPFDQGVASPQPGEPASRVVRKPIVWRSSQRPPKKARSKPGGGNGATGRKIWGGHLLALLGATLVLGEAPHVAGGQTRPPRWPNRARRVGPKRLGGWGGCACRLAAAVP